MTGFSRISWPEKWFERAIVFCVGAAWLWKIGEYIGRATGLLRRQLGRGFFVDATIPFVLTVAAVLYLIIRLVVVRLGSGELRRR